MDSSWKHIYQNRPRILLYVEPGFTLILRVGQFFIWVTFLPLLVLVPHLFDSCFTNIGAMHCPTRCLV
jgi:hypothetical protein